MSGTSNATYEVAVDGAKPPIVQDQNLLFAAANLELKSHTLALMVLSNDTSQLLSFGSVTITTSRCVSTAYSISLC